MSNLDREASIEAVVTCYLVGGVGFTPARLRTVLINSPWDRDTEREQKRDSETHRHTHFHTLTYTHHTQMLSVNKPPNMPYIQ